MPTAIHSFSQEEMMAYFDGELPAERASAAAQHLEQCRECQRLAADFQSVSHRLTDWTFEASASAPPQILEGTGEIARRAFWKQPSVLIASAAAVLLLVWGVSVRRSITNDDRLAPSVTSAQRYSVIAPRRQAFMAEEQGASAGFRPDGVIGGVIGGVPGVPAPPPPAPVPGAPPSGPLIVRTAQLTVTSKSFDQSRAQVERIARTYQGYISELSFNTPNGAARTLTATLRAPAAQMDAVLQDLRHLGHVDSEAQGGQDVTQHYVDVNARLANLRTTEERLLQILRDRTGRLADVLQVEEAVDRTRGEIETTEAEQKSLSTQIAFATVNLTLSEEYKAPLNTGETSALIRLRNAAVEGYRNVVGLVMDVVEFLLSAGPVLLILVAVAFVPALWLWRRRDAKLWPFAQ